MSPQKVSCTTAHMPSIGRSIPNCLYQFSIHSAYLLGARADGLPVSFLNSYGDYAFCLFPDSTPLLLKDSKPYHFATDNKASTPHANAQLAFAMICAFAPENRVNNGGGDTMANLRETFAKGKYDCDGRNNPLPFCVRGAFSSVTTKYGELKNVQGMIFGFALPKWMESLSGPGARCCFLSGCHRYGGEVVDFKSIAGTFVEWAITENCHIGLPRDEKFETMEL